MNKTLLALACILLAIFSANAQTRKAVSVLTPTTAGPAGSTGVLEIVEMNNMTRIVGTFNGLPPNTVHQVHIHTWGNIASATGAATGDHYNPTMMNHTSHVGDLGNVTVNAQGVGSINITNNEVKLNGQFSVIGRAAVLQLGTSEDGTRLMQGVIGIEGNDRNSTATNQNGQFASAELVGVNGFDVTGRVNFEQLGGGMVLVTAAICGLQPNSSRGFHIHYFGDLRNNGSGFDTHYNPLGQLHGYPPRLDRHVGDMGNLTVDANGRASLMQVFNLQSLNDTTSVIGRGLVVHSKNDDGGQPTGNAGPYAAIAVIGIVNPLPSLPATCPTAAPTTAAPTTTAPTTVAPTTATPVVSAASVMRLSAFAVIVILALLF